MPALATPSQLLDLEQSPLGLNLPTCEMSQQGRDSPVAVAWVGVAERSFIHATNQQGVQPAWQEVSRVLSDRTENFRALVGFSFTLLLAVEPRCGSDSFLTQGSHC